jgi:hypothetical protein
MANKSIICQRGLWFNGERSTKPEVLAIRLQDLARRRAANAEKERLVSNNLQKAATKAAQLSAAEQVVAILPKIDKSFFGTCAAECMQTPRPPEVAVVDNMRRSCTTCEKFFCKNVSCQKRLRTQQEFCTAKGILGRTV